jgi:LacI family transcriptional regulator
LEEIQKALDAGEMDGLAISPYEPERFTGVIDALMERGIPVITYNNDVVDSTRLCFVGTNYYKNGKLAGEVLGKHMRGGTAVSLSCRTNYWHTYERLNGFREGIGQFPQISHAGPFKGLADRETAFEKMKTILETTPDISGIYIMDTQEGVISGVCEAVRQYAANPVRIVTIDLNTECAENIKNDTVTASICQDPFSQSYYAVKHLFKYLVQGKRPGAQVYQTRLDVIYKENLANYDIEREIIMI